MIYARIGEACIAFSSSPHPPYFNHCPNLHRIYNTEIGSENQRYGIFFLPEVFATVWVLCICPDDSYIKPQEKKNSICFFIKVQPLPCQSNPFISLSMDCSCQPVIIVRYLDNSRLIIPTSEKLPFVNYIATNEAQMHSRRCPLSLSLSLSCTGAKPQDQHWHLNSVLMEAWDFRPHHSEGLFHCEHVEIAFT